jgi:translation initiation factor 5B
MLTDRGTHFVVALNKIDRSYQWISAPDSSSYVSLKAQSGPTVQDYTNRLNQVKLQLNQEGFNIAMYWEN